MVVQMIHRLGFFVSATVIGHDFCVAEDDARLRQLAECREKIDYAAVTGAPVIRIFAGKVHKNDTEDAIIVLMRFQTSRSDFDR